MGLLDRLCGNVNDAISERNDVNRELSSAHSSGDSERVADLRSQLSSCDERISAARSEQDSVTSSLNEGREHGGLSSFTGEY